MDCNDCKEKMMIYLDGHVVTGRDLSLQFEEHIKSCPRCAQEVRELKESLLLVENDEVFIPDSVGAIRELPLLIESEESEKIGRAEIEMPQVIKNAIHIEYPQTQKEKKYWFSFMPSRRFASLRTAYAMAIILCLGLGLYLVTFISNNNMLAPQSPIALKTAPAERTAPLSAPQLNEKKNVETPRRAVSTAAPIKEAAKIQSDKGKKTVPAQTPLSPAPPAPQDNLFAMKKEVKPQGAAHPGASQQSVSPPAATPAPSAGSTAITPQSIPIKPAAIQPAKEKTPAPTSKDEEYGAVTQSCEPRDIEQAIQSGATGKSAQPKQTPSPGASQTPPSQAAPSQDDEFRAKVKKIVSEYKDVSFEIKKENKETKICLFFPKDTKKETIDELTNKLINQLKIDKNKIVVTIK